MSIIIFFNGLGSKKLAYKLKWWLRPRRYRACSLFLLRALDTSRLFGLKANRYLLIIEGLSLADEESAGSDSLFFFCLKDYKRRQICYDVDNIEEQWAQSNRRRYYELQFNYEPLLLICGSRSTENVLLECFVGFLPKEVPIILSFFL